MSALPWPWAQCRCPPAQSLWEAHTSADNTLENAWSSFWMGWGALLSLNQKVFFPWGKEKLRRKKKMFATGAWISSFVSKDRKTPGPSRLSIEFYVPFQNRLILSWLARLHSVWCLTQFYLSSSNHTFYLFFNREKATQNYYCSFPRSSCSSENSESLEQSKAHCNREHRSRGYYWPRLQTTQPCYCERVLRLAIFAYPQSFSEIHLPPRPSESEHAYELLS